MSKTELRRWYVWVAPDGLFVASPMFTGALWAKDVRKALWTNSPNVDHSSIRIQRAMSKCRPTPLTLGVPQAQGTTFVSPIQTASAAKVKKTLAEVMAERRAQQ